MYILWPKKHEKVSIYLNADKKGLVEYQTMTFIQFLSAKLKSVLRERQFSGHYWTIQINVWRIGPFIGRAFTNIDCMDIKFMTLGTANELT